MRARLAAFLSAARLAAADFSGLRGRSVAASAGSVACAAAAEPSSARAGAGTPTADAETAADGTAGAESAAPIAAEGADCGVARAGASSVRLETAVFTAGAARRAGPGASFGGGAKTKGVIRSKG